MITAAGIATLVAIFMYQVAYATNESSYKHGFNIAYNGYRCTVTDDCSPPANSALDSTCTNTQHVTNTTACIDGYLHGWKSWCSLDTKVCLSDVLSGTFPDIDKVLKPNPPSANTTFAAEATETG
jgi:hypothetical protein